MNIEYLQISNVLSFPFHQNIEDAQKIDFDSRLNIIIGENGSGKSTALEILNFFFKRVIYHQYEMNENLFAERDSISVDRSKQILQPRSDQDSFSGFRMEPNWANENDPQKIRICLRLDDIDRANIENIKNNSKKIESCAQSYSMHFAGIYFNSDISEIYVLDVDLHKQSKTFRVSLVEGGNNFGYQYLLNYYFFKELISIHNRIDPSNPIPQLYESFILISGYRNYHAFQAYVTLQSSPPNQQIRQITQQEYNRSLNVADQSEPSIFTLVKLRVAQCHFDLIRQKMSEDECEEKANKIDFMILINEKLKLVKLKCQIKSTNIRTWQYYFEFIDLRRGRTISDINALSAGQKAIIHLIFEAYGRDNLRGGVFMIDEPEIHLHYQFQHEYLQVIDALKREQQCQYILVTHSEALINSSTINNMYRFTLTQDGHTEIFSPTLDSDKKSLIKILDNTRSTYAFFAKKVVLVEGDTDRYFFRAILQKKYCSLNQEIAILFVQGKHEFKKWKNLFKTFGLQVFIIADFDYIVDQHYQKESRVQLKEGEEISDFKRSHPNWEEKITDSMNNDIFILREGCLETYLDIEKKDLAQVISFCEEKLDDFLNDKKSSRTIEVIEIFEKVTQA